MDNLLWVEAYRPSTIDECILPAEIKNTFKSILKQGEIPNLLLSGTAGTGKTTVAKALCNELDLDVMMINGSDEGRSIDTVRNQIKNFASTVSLSETNKPKVVIVDEADYMNAESVQPALRNFIETFSGNCRFIFTCNYKNKIIPAIHSRCTVINFAIQNKDKEQYLEFILLEFPDFCKQVSMEASATPGSLDSAYKLATAPMAATLLSPATFCSFLTMYSAEPYGRVFLLLVSLVSTASRKVCGASSIGIDFLTVLRGALFGIIKI